MDHKELHDAMEWLRKAVMTGEAALAGDLKDEVRAEWNLAMARNRALLQKLERINEALLVSGCRADDSERTGSSEDVVGGAEPGKGIRHSCEGSGESNRWRIVESRTA